MSQDHLFRFVLRLADDQLIAGHRMSEWTGHAPSLEENLAMPNLALDMIGQAQALYQYAAKLTLASDPSITEDSLAFCRSDREYSNLIMLEKPNGDFARTMLKHLYYSFFMNHFWLGLCNSSDLSLAAIAGKATKECRYHVRHCGQWIIRLGDGTEESATKLKLAAEYLVPFLGEMFLDDELSIALHQNKTAPLPSSIKPLWLKDFSEIASQAFMEIPSLEVMQKGGRDGIHSEDLGYLLTEMQFLHRSHPNVQW